MRYVCRKKVLNVKKDFTKLKISFNFINIIFTFVINNSGFKHFIFKTKISVDFKNKFIHSFISLYCFFCNNNKYSYKFFNICFVKHNTLSFSAIKFKQALNNL